MNADGLTTQVGVSDIKDGDKFGRVVITTYSLSSFILVYFPEKRVESSSKEET